VTENSNGGRLLMDFHHPRLRRSLVGPRPLSSHRPEDDSSVASLAPLRITMVCRACTLVCITAMVVGILKGAPDERRREPTRHSDRAVARTVGIRSGKAASAGTVSHGRSEGIARNSSCGRMPFAAIAAFGPLPPMAAQKRGFSRRSQTVRPGLRSFSIFVSDLVNDFGTLPFSFRSESEL